MSVVCFGDSGVHLIELQILTRRVGKKVYIFLKDVCKKALKGIFLRISETFELCYRN